MRTLTEASFSVTLDDDDAAFNPLSASTTHSSPPSATPHFESELKEVRRKCIRSVQPYTLRLVGLNRDYLESMATRLLKIIFFPEPRAE
jgi:hypothetical protein